MRAVDILYKVENLYFLKYAYRNPTGFRRWLKVAESCQKK